MSTFLEEGRMALCRVRVNEREDVGRSRGVRGARGGDGEERIRRWCYAEV